MIKVGLRVSAAMALAMFAASPLLSAKLRLPPPTAPKDKIHSPLAVAGDLQKRGYTIESITRQGTAYSIKAVGPHRNKVQLMVDGRSGEIVGLAVLDAAANMAAAIAQAMRSGKNARYVDDLHPFGIIVPDVYQTRWTPIASWTTGPLYIDAAASGRGYRYAVPFSSVRPGKGGRSRSRIPPSRMQRPLYDVHEANGAELETESAEDSTIISEVTVEETTYSEEYAAMEESYLGGEFDEASYEKISDFDAEDGDLSFADDAGDDYETGVDEEEDEGEGEEEVDQVEADDGEEEADDSADEDEGDYEDDSGDEDEGDYEDDSGDDEYYDDGGDEDYDDGGDEPDLAAAK